MNPTDFFKKLIRYAIQVAQVLGCSPATFAPVILAQWAHESGFESPTWVGHNNYAGITDGGPPNFLQYSSVSEFCGDYVRVLRLHYYDAVYAAAINGCDAETIAVLLGVSPWDAGHYQPDDGEYAGVPGGFLLRMMKTYDLTRLVQAFLAQPEPPAPAADITTGGQTAQSPTVPPAEPAPADDEPSGFARPFVAWAVSHGISDGSRPHAPATREEVMTMIARAMGCPAH